MVQYNFNGLNSDGLFTMADKNYHQSPYRSFCAKYTLDGWDYPWLELFFMVPSLFEPLKFYSMYFFL